MPKLLVIHQNQSRADAVSLLLSPAFLINRTESFHVRVLVWGTFVFIP